MIEFNFLYNYANIFFYRCYCYLSSESKSDLHSPVADPGFPVGGGANLLCIYQTLNHIITKHTGYNEDLSQRRIYLSQCDIHLSRYIKMQFRFSSGADVSN